MPTPFQTEQMNEAANRTQANLDPDTGLPRGADQRQTPIDDSTGQRQPRPADLPEDRGGAEDHQDEPADRRSPGDIKRAEIAARFKHRGDDGDVPYNGNPNDPEMQYGDIGRAFNEQESGDGDADARTDNTPAPRAEEAPKRKLIIRGKDVWLTEAEILARASQVEAADSYLQESKDLLAEARAIRNSAKRDGPDHQHPDGENDAQDDGLNRETTQGDQHPDALIEAIEEIQFGDPKNAAAKIRQAIDMAADQSADQRQLRRLEANDYANSKKALKAFTDQNPDLANDETAAIVLAKNVHDVYREDITKLGIDPALIPNDNASVAQWHQWYRIHGHPVRSTPEVLNEAKAKYDHWRGVGPKPAGQQQRSTTAPRVEVNVDRNARRAALPNQPSRAVAPRPDAVRQAPTTTSRSDIVMNMRKARGQTTN